MFRPLHQALFTDRTILFHREQKATHMKKTQILLIEENRILREGIVSLLKTQTDMAVAVVSEESIFGTTHTSGVALLSFHYRNKNSLELVAKIKKNLPVVKIIVMNLIPLQEDILNFVQAGASGFILKEATNNEFVNTIRTVSLGVHVLPQHLTKSLFSQIVEGSMNGFKPSIVVDTVRMSKREQEIIALITDGLSNSEIAQSLHLSVYTIKSHVHNILSKLAVNTRIQISKYTPHVPPVNLAAN